MRSYLRLLRLPYQFQLGPIFAWGYLLAGGRLEGGAETARFTAVFVLFHIGAFGGLTALNSYYDRDEGPIGGLWQPPPPPPHLWHFAWTVQLGGLLLLLPFSAPLAAIYSVILLLSLGYSHPRSRWKGHPFKSLATVALGQGVLDFAAGALTVWSPVWTPGTWLGMAGATLNVIAFYPLTQLYQVADDMTRGDHTVAAWLVHRWSRRVLFGVCAALFIAGAGCNTLALRHGGWPTEAKFLAAATLIPLLLLAHWSHAPDHTPRRDFSQVHTLLRLMAVAFAGFIAYLLLGSDS